MNIAVCVKRTPDTEARLRIADGGDAVDPSGVKYIISPYDEYAIEAALQTREGIGEGEVTLLSVGQEEVQETLRSGLAMGADRAVLLKGAVILDGLATARALAAELAGMDVPLVLLGVKAADDDQQQVGPMVATVLGRPCATSVAEFELSGEVVRCHREVEGGIEILELDLPAVITLTKGKFEPRYASLKGIMAAKRKPLEEKAAQLGESHLKLESLSYPPERPAGKIVGEGADAVPELVRLLRDEAKAL